MPGYLDRALNKIRGSYREFVAADVVSNDGVKLIVDRQSLADPAIIRALLYNRHERTEADLVRYAVQPGDRILELGSGVGFITMLCARICGASNVVTFEGNPTMHGLLKRNLHLNGLDVDARQAVVSLEGGPVEFQVSESLVSSSLYGRGNTTAHVVESVSFGSLLAQFKPSMIIMDIEGSEIDLLGTVALPGVRAIGVETHPQIVGAEAIHRMTRQLADMGFEIDSRFPTESSRHLYVRNLQAPSRRN